MQSLTRLACVVGAVVSVGLFNTIVLAQPDGANPPSALRRATQDRFNLITDLALVSPTESQAGMIQQSYEIHRDWLALPTEPAPEITQRLAQSYGELYDRVRQQHTVVRVGWNGQGPQRLEGKALLSLTRGLDSVVLLEVTNQTAQAVRLVAMFPGPSRGLPSPVEIPPGEQRTIWASLTVSNAVVKYVPLKFSVAGGSPTEITLAVKAVEPAHLRGRLIEGSTGEVFPGRVQVLGSDQRLRRDLRLGANDTLSSKSQLDLMFGGVGKNYTLPFFYSDGTFDIAVPPGATRVTLERGFEHPLVTTNLVLKSGETREITLSSQRFLDMKKLGWVSGDTHIHWAKNSWDVNEDIALLGVVQRAEDLRVANNLTLKHHTTNQNFIAPTQFPMGPIPGYCTEDWHIQMAEEYRNEEFYGHLIFLNIKRLIEPISTGSMGGPTFLDYPINKTAIAEAHRQGGISIEAHGLGPNNDVPVNVAQELSDSLDQLAAEDYYRFLDCGFRLPLSNGSDHPARVAGCARVYVKTPMPFAYENWIAGIRAGHTFTTSGPLLFLGVNGHDIGDVFNVSAGTPLKIKARAVSRFPLRHFQIVSNGKIIAATNTTATSAELFLEMPAGEPRWIVARCSPNDIFTPLVGASTNPDTAHTSAIYVQVDGRPRFVANAAQEWINRMRIHADDLAKRGHFANDVEREEAVAHVRAGIAAYEKLIAKFSSQPLEKGSRIQLTPLPTGNLIKRQPSMREGQDLNRIAFHIRTPWTTGPIELRFPEVLRSSMGFHFLDNYSATIQPLHEWDSFPQWQTDTNTGGLHYEFKTPEGLRFCGTATPTGDEVRLQFTVGNETGQAINHVDANCCLAFNDCPELGAKWQPENIFAMLDGQWRSFDHATPTAKAMGRQPWYLSLRAEAAKTTPLPRVSPTWWMIDQHHTENLMSAVARDRQHLVGYTWSVEPIGLMSNGGNPCLHTGMGDSPEISPGKSFTWWGKIYFLPNDPEELLKRYRADQANWRSLNQNTDWCPHQNEH